MSFPFAPSWTAPSGSAGPQQRLPFPRYNGQSIEQLQSEMNDEVPDNYNTGAAQQRLQAVEAARATATSNDINRDGMSLGVPAPDQYPTRLLPNPTKRKRYSIDDVTFQLGKVRVNKAGQANINIIPPDDEKVDYFNTFRRASDWDKHVDDDFHTLPSDLQDSLRQALTTRTVSQRKASDRIARELSGTTRPDSSPSNKSSFDLIKSISSSIEILVSVGKHLRPRDILNLYSTSRDFHATLDTHMRSSVLVWARHSCRPAADIFPHHFYLVHARSTRTRDIVASLARRGHRLPPGTATTLLKLWLVLDLPTNADRCAVMRSTAYFTRQDLYRCLVFLVKLLMRFNDPLYGPDHGVLMELMLGQRGLTPLWRLLRGKGYTALREVVAAKIRYDVRPTVAEREAGTPVMGVAVDEMGGEHLEGWGRGGEHLLRPDELVARECARRGIEAHECIEAMAVYGHVDIALAVDLTPEVEELYMSDEELPGEIPVEERGRRDVLVHGGGGNVPFQDGEWTPKIVRKAKWETLSEEERRAIEEDDKDEVLKSLVWEEDSRVLSSEEVSEESDGSEGMVSVADVRDHRKMKGKMVDRVKGGKNLWVFDDDSVLGGDSEDDGTDDISDEESDVGIHSRVSSSNMPELQSRVCSSINSIPVMTPRLVADSPDLVGIGLHDGHHMMDMDEMDLDDENMDSTLLASSLTATPLKCAASQQPERSDEESSEEEDSDDGLDDEERKRIADKRDEELRAQADDYYSEDELEYDWDAWKELATLTIQARGDGDDEGGGDEEEVRDYPRLY
ncbi:hypothetical protein CONLIGDRAFT_669972 [Coniochaeta ligniaria NRRL 30616]|uniref:Uncharacterized protein n=1 Tax=Coniochaeta ligniaria NRRL 30616 TaxID=1408157 RepID=A0A1J7ISZ1_9PEZI|nr:hypothetical protein CONLIGDRAFT_669972 [Coniochaeta ligniaria NRRL 30616]